MSTKKIYRKDVPLLPVIEPKVGELYHTTWAFKHGHVWRCVDVDLNTRTVQLMTPKTKKLVKFRTKFSDLRYTRRAQTKIENDQRPETR